MYFQESSNKQNNRVNLQVYLESAGMVYFSDQILFPIPN